MKALVFFFGGYTKVEEVTGSIELSQELKLNPIILGLKFAEVKPDGAKGYWIWEGTIKITPLPLEDKQVSSQKVEITNSNWKRSKWGSIDE